MTYAKAENVPALVLIALARLNGSARFGDPEKRIEASFPVEATVEVTVEA
jgi:hypothetical protein